ncbi:unnamed protein product [Parnassius apollo]|uniref:(apollo) hypothetical protein n=1 Tax=Parnassius apollo TaxID=110799 RepID=A0A8S3WKV5_PARAO|nr:unnamed protein product [Parnassius apollo]
MLKQIIICFRLDPPITQSQFAMENKKAAPATQQPLTQQHLMAHHVHADQIYSPQHTQIPLHMATQTSQIQPNSVMHQLLQSQYHSNMNARSPLLENRHELYGTGYNNDYARHYGANDNYNYPQSPPKQERTEIHTDHNINHDILHNMPKGYNAEVYQDYLKRNPPKDTNQIYQNHQPMYRLNANQYSSKPYLPYSNRIGPQSNTELLRRQYNEIQQMKMQQQLHYQNQAQMHQQQKFAERQLLLQQIHGVQPPPNLQNSIYSDGSFRDLDRYASKNDFKDYELQKDVEGYSKNNETRESEKQIRQYQDPNQDTQRQLNQSVDFRESDRYRKQEDEKTNNRTPSTDFNNHSQKNNVNVVSPMKSSDSSTPSIKSPSSESRRSSSGTQALRSPIAQRVPSAPVAMSGILYKQGSDGLKVWRKRWFVLSEYCLFYYKSQDEEKLLGSVLLPSYKVSACTAEDKVMRKFAFKLEHANMRTYILAALDQEAMTKWVKLLTMAALMQNSNDQPQRNDRMTAKSEDGEEAGPTYANAPPKPRRSNEGYNSPSPDMYDPNYDLLKNPASHYSQDTNNTRYHDYNNYPNSPNQEATYTRSPQPSFSQQQAQYQTKRQYDTHNLSLPLTNTITERLENNQFNSPSTYQSNPQSPYFENRNRNQQQYQAIHDTKTNKDQIYEQRMQRNPFLQDVVQQNETPARDEDLQNRSNTSVTEQSCPSSGYNESYPEAHTETSSNDKDVYGESNKPSRSGSNVNERLIERRTPDAYGRASSVSTYAKEKVDDYEDLYAIENEYGKTYAKSPKQNQARDNISISSHKQVQDQNSKSHQEKTFSGPAVLRRKKMQSSGVQPPMPRPHSADFLEYESKNETLNKTVPARAVCDPPRQPQRPKSSLDINSYYDPSSDRYYSEESYAEKMRQSAQYLQQQAAGSRNIQIPLAKYASGLAEKQLNSAYSQFTNNNYESEYGIKRSSRDNLSYNSKYSDIEGLNANWTLKEKEKDYLNRSGSVMSDGSNVSGCVKNVNKFDSNADGFMRSASARLPSSATEREGEKKVQQREESMKRLLEWKQRMLQSPLTRKSTPATISLARSLSHSRQSLRSDQYKSKTYANASYNSYSSDDEEETSGTDLQMRNTQAGRSNSVKVTSPNIMQPINPHAPFIAQSNEKVLIEDDKDIVNDNTYENILCDNVSIKLNNNTDEKDDSYMQVNRSDCEHETTKENEDISGYETHESEAESETYIEYTDNDLDEVLLTSDTEIKNAGDCDLNECDRKQNDKIFTEEQLKEKSSTPPVRPFGEEHYLPMSPRKTSMLEPAHKTIIQNLSVFDQTMPQSYEDNPYVEMSLGTDEEDMQTYEIVCVNNGKVEPVYMEVKNGTVEENDSESVILRDKSLTDTASNFADTKQQTLKRVSKGEKTKEKSDCSDADDEVSRDMSLDIPFNRMSISDTFRPASYYLSGSRTILYTQNSSDSEVYPPPPIPSSSPPCEELSDEALSKYILDKLDKSDIPQDSSILKMLTNENQKKINAKRRTTSLMIYGSRTAIHDTLTRGEKIRNSRASLANETKKSKEFPSILQDNFISEQNICSGIDTESLQSYNADRGSSRLSLESDVSSKFDMIPSNMSSEVTSVGSDSIVDLSHMCTLRDIENMIKRRPLSDDSLFELSTSENNNRNDSVTNIDLDRYLGNLQPLSSDIACENNYENSHVRDSSRGYRLVNNDDAAHTQVHTAIHQRCSSTPINHHSSSEDKINISTQYRKLEEHVSGYIGSQSSCSSVGLAKSPISFYCKNNDERTLLRKNLNNEPSTNKIKEFENEKFTPKCGIDTNASSTSTGFHSRESSTEHSAPYYYSDLSSQEHVNVLPTSHFLKNTNLHRKLNNQRRRGPLQKKNEISHIHNPIRSNQVLMSDPSFELASTARSVSVEFLSAADKDSDIDTKNIYESNGGKSSKIPESMNLISSLGCKRSSNQNNNDQNSPRDLSGLNRVSLNTSSIQLSSASMSSHCSGNSSNTVYYDAEAEASAYENVLCQGEKHWDEDSLWRDNLRRVSHRHARSMDDLDTVPAEPLSNRSGMDSCGMHSIKRIKRNAINKINRYATYVNSEIQEQIPRRKDHYSGLQYMYSEEGEKVDDNDVYVSLAEDSEPCNEPSDEGVYEQLAVGPIENSSLLSESVVHKCKSQENSRKQFEIDREKLRQWDLMSSGLMKGRAGGAQGVGVGMVVGEVLTDIRTDNTSNEASTTMPATNLETSNNNNSTQQTLSKKAFLGSNTSIGRSNRDANIPVRAVSPRVRWVEEKQSNDHYSAQQMSNSQQNLHALNTAQNSWVTARSPSRTLQQPISAVSPRVRRNVDNDDLQWDLQPIGQGDQLSKNPTAGELLGRTHEELVLLLIQLRRRHAATHRSIEQCCAQISSIEDCLSSLKAMEREESLQRLNQLKKQLMDLEHQYEKSKPLVQLVDNMVKLGSLYNRPGSTIERLERNQKLRQKVLAEHALEQQRWLESAAAGKTLETEAARARVAELWALEQELADEAAILQGLKTDKDTIDTLLRGVRSRLDNAPREEIRTQNSGGGLEAELARVHAMLAHNSKKLEQTVADNARLERELQQLRRALQARRASAHAHAPHTARPTALLEDEVSRVQQLVSALQRQRQELSRAVRHLTQQSRALQTTHDSMPGKRRSTTSWQETNLDTGHTTDHGQSDYDYETTSLVPPGHYERSHVDVPLYVDTRGPGADVTSPLTSEDMQHNAFSNLSNVEKQEIKTVRIVKRESERRQRDRERSLQPMSDWPGNNITANLDQFLEEELVQPINYTRASSLPRTDYSKYDDYYTKSQNVDPPNYLRLNDKNMELSPKYPSSPSLSNYDYSRDVSSVSSSYHKSYDRSGYDRTISLSTQYLNSPTDSSRTLTNDPLSKTSSIVSLTRSNMELSPIFKSEAAKQIITEMSGDGHKNGSMHRRKVPKEKRRHYTAPHHLSAKTLNEMPKDVFNQDATSRSLDDADMERALRGGAPDVVRSALPALPARRGPDSIDQLLAAPQKILIPERYIPEKPPELSPEEQQKRQEKVESIKKMLTDSTADSSKSPDGEEKRQRKHLLQMNQILAKQVTEMSKIIAVRALEELPLQDNTEDLDDRSPDVELPIYQQRDNFFT